MIYIVLNIVIAIMCILLSIYVDTRTGSQADNPLIPLLLVLSSIAGFSAFCILISSVAPARLMLFIGRLYLLDQAVFFLMTANYCVNFPKYETPLPWKIAFSLCTLVAFYIVFTKIHSFTINKYCGFYIDSEYVFSGQLGELVRLNWEELFFGIFAVFIPAEAALMMLVRSENISSKIDSQKMYLNATGIALGWLVALLIAHGAARVPMFNTLFTLSHVLVMLLFIQASTHNMLYDFEFISTTAARFLARYVLTSFLGGLIFALFYPLMRNYEIHFLIVITIATGLVLTLSHQIFKMYGRRSQFRDSQSAKNFEDDIAAIDFNTEPSNILNQLFTIFKTNMRTTSLSIMVDNGRGELEVTYSTNPLPDEDRFSISINSTMLDGLWNINQRVVLRINAETQYIYQPFRQDLLSFFKSTNSDAFIVLHEGRRIIGIIVLGAKKDENMYDDVDYALFNKLYSYFFVVGFYMKNIVNETVVGTVNREIRMSEQIITSIQENMDKMTNPKADLGYIMVPAHNIGGEFIDIIKLSEDKYIYIIGSLSGKGISASMSMVILKSIIRTYLVETSDFKLLVNKVNYFISKSLPLGTFFAGVFILMDYSSDTLYYVNCGTAALFMYNQIYNNVIEIQGDGRVLGFMDDVSALIKVKKVKLNKGDIILSCTNGLITSSSLRGEIFGKTRVQDTLLENLTYPASRMAQFTYDALVKFAAKELSDDVSVLVIKYQGQK